MILKQPIRLSHRTPGKWCWKFEMLNLPQICRDRDRIGDFLMRKRPKQCWWVCTLRSYFIPCFSNSKFQVVPHELLERAYYLIFFQFLNQTNFQISWCIDWTIALNFLQVWYHLISLMFWETNLYFSFSKELKQGVKQVKIIATSVFLFFQNSDQRKC